MHITLPAGQAVRINSATRPPTILVCTVFVYERDRLCTAMRLCLRWLYTFSSTLTVCTFTTTRRDCITASQFTSDRSRTSPLVARIWVFILFSKMQELPRSSLSSRFVWTDTCVQHATWSIRGYEHGQSAIGEDACFVLFSAFFFFSCNMAWIRVIPINLSLVVFFFRWRIMWHDPTVISKMSMTL